MDVREFVKKQESALKRYRRIYKLLDFLIILILAYTFMLLLSIDQILPRIDGLDVYVGTNYSLAGFSIPFENLILALVAAFLSLVLVLLLHLRNRTTSAILQIEEKYPDLRERLRTAYDNSDLDNTIVEDLEQKVSVRVSQVDPLVLLSKKVLFIGVIVLLLSSISVTYVTVYNIHIIEPDEMDEILDGLPGFTPDNSNPDGIFEIDEEEDEQDGNSGNEDLTGEPTVVVVDGKEVDLSLPPGTGTGFQPNEEAEDIIDEFENSPGGTPTATPSGTYYEELPDGYESVIKSYFEQMAEE